MPTTLDLLTEKYNPNNIAYYFWKISQVPRQSGHEEKISNFLVDFAKEQSLSYIQDKVGNVIIYKPAAPGYENLAPVILQGHMDMVCEKVPTSTHNFSTDPLELIIKEDFLMANGTTLGADDGISLAYGLAILADTTLSHPALEVVFTVSEETDFTGVANLDYSLLKGKELINIDSSNDQRLTVSSAGGASFMLTQTLNCMPISQEYTTLSVEIDGGIGGHSGEDIHRQRANAIIELATSLSNLKTYISTDKIELIAINGGAASNAIPRSAQAIIAIPHNELSKINVWLSFEQKKLKERYQHSDPHISLSIAPLITSQLPMNHICKNELLSLLLSVPVGIIKKDATIQDFILTSNSIGCIKTVENSITIFGEIRSVDTKEANFVFQDIEAITNSMITITSHCLMTYPEWAFKKESSLRDKFQKARIHLLGTRAELEMVHAGLECSYFSQYMQDIDCISIGPTIYDLHTPQERMELTSFVTMWHILIEVLTMK
ncbi:beta-Ala-His dipeptidase [Veillonella montpellierensis]|uniref:beta-Ala-His dipeptidase n=1 Tax=Veillonella montpellierensis TaxID=187328 RepID=UPI0023F85561|nr:beta-Ala-His dipeptidase [Veillonella montpellierensis]